MASPADNVTIRSRAFRIVEAGLTHDLPGRAFDAALAALIVLNVVAVVLETVPSIYAAHAPYFDGFERFSVAVFGLEYCLRVWTAIENPIYQGLSPFRARIKYVFSTYALIDLIAILPALLAFFALPDLRYLRIMRFVRLLKLGRFSPALASLGQVIYEERRALTATLIIILAAMMFAASAMHFIERAVQPDQFGTIPDALWWAVSTLTTVGYGDVVPVTPVGKLFGSVFMIVCLGIYALPVGIVASGFAREIHRRDFVVSWSMVARVPIFAGLEASVIGQIATLLHARVVEANTVIARRGEPAQGMYFIVSGEVEVRTGEKPVLLSDGDFFGEKALLHKTERTTTVVAKTKTRLMVLEASDFRHLIETQPNVGRAIRLTARSRGSTLPEDEEDASQPNGKETA